MFSNLSSTSAPRQAALPVVGVVLRESFFCDWGRGRGIEEGERKRGRGEGGKEEEERGGGRGGRREGKGIRRRRE